MTYSFQSNGKSCGNENVQMSLNSLFVTETQKIILFGKSTVESKNNAFQNQF